MIGLHLDWNGVPLDPGLAERFASSLGMGLPDPIAHNSRGGFTTACEVRDKRLARSWTPARGPDGSQILIMGYIDNRAEVIAGLPGPIDPSCDNATLYGHAYAHWGDECDLKLIGDYAAILWPASGESVRLVRSPINAPPLHFWRGKHRLIISSVPRAIFATGEVRQEVDQQKIADSLYLNYREGSRGWFKGVERVPLASQVTITREGSRSTEFFDPFARGPVRLKSDDDYVEAANALFDEATRAVLGGFKKPAISVSGGYDSQAVTVHALDSLPETAGLKAYSSVPEAGWDGRSPSNRFGDESEHVKALAAMHPRLDVEFVGAEGLSFDHKLDAMFMTAGAPPRNAMNLHWIHEIGTRAKQAGCDVILTGARGNATFSFDGTGAIPGWFKAREYERMARELWALRHEHTSIVHAFASQLVLPLMPSKHAEVIERWRGGSVAEEVFDTWCPLNQDWAVENGVVERAEEMGFDAAFAKQASTEERRRAMTGNASNEGGDIQLAMEMISGMPRRDPTAYRPLLEFCFNIPDDQYLRNGKRRWLAKRMLKGRVPDMVLNEKRRGLQAADKMLRLHRQRDHLIAEVDRLAEDPDMAAMLNLPRLRALLENSSPDSPVSRDDPAHYAALALSRAITTSRFIRYVSGANR